METDNAEAKVQQRTPQYNAAEPEGVKAVDMGYLKLRYTTKLESLKASLQVSLQLVANIEKTLEIIIKINGNDDMDPSDTLRVYREIITVVEMGMDSI
ncbi:hypothetical protein CONLIGDRAFT_686864 [Coniochaeta ligniaria NRRL 30616]|uniref:Uncharacterized protein n=1 Tax=Coniochaeta ligniaria NRRL 30616 TaxID=1408157 RepID=A0A1J7I6U7_9PEZI|nr:hypothetical protein CONLIGDRAFT_686864 [Coniochaeta ligniaria NRRL 30616]